MRVYAVACAICLRREVTGKLTYGAYLIHPIILRAYYYQMTHLFDMNVFNQTMVRASCYDLARTLGAHPCPYPECVVLIPCVSRAVCCTPCTGFRGHRNAIVWPVDGASYNGRITIRQPHQIPHVVTNNNKKAQVHNGRVHS